MERKEVRTMQQPNWKPGETTETARPEEIIMGTGRIKARRNITRETRTTETGKQKVWVYEYADMTLAQYEEIRSGSGTA